jgi:hypothetical protein
MAAAEKREVTPTIDVIGMADTMSFSDVNKLLLLSDRASRHLEADGSTGGLSAWELPLGEAARHERAGASPEEMAARGSLRVDEDSELTAANVIRLLSRNLEQERNLEASSVVAGEYLNWESAVSSMSLRKNAVIPESQNKAE